MRVALYAWVSTRDKGQEPDTQLVQLRHLAETQGWQITEEYIDYESGSKSDRTRFQTMIRDAAARKFDLVLFWALDRFSREGTLPTLRWLELLEGYGVRWRSLTEPWIDSAGPFREVIVNLLASLAKQERLRVTERVHAGLQRARQNGTTIGRPRRIFDHNQVVKLRQRGLSFRQIARKMSLGEGTVRRAFVARGDQPEARHNPAIGRLPDNPD